MKYDITYVEYRTYSKTVEANSKEEALDKFDAIYDKEGSESSSFDSCDLADIDPEVDVTEVS